LVKIRNWPWEPNPDYTRLLKALRRRGDPYHVPFLELFADREVIAAVLDEQVIPREAEKTDRDVLERALDQKIRFWYHLGYDAFCELEREYLESLGLQDHFGNEMNGDEGALAAMWLGLEYAIICHYLSPEGREDVRKFFNILESRHSDEGPLVKPLALRPGQASEPKKKNSPFQESRQTPVCSTPRCLYPCI
jgi:hypothetical protein